jgi:glycosyltransferase involved in cell wall biosynthesis
VLPHAVESLLAQDLPPERFEILVVDNASTDGTSETVRRRWGAAANLRVVDEPRLGVSHARNTGWRHARAPLVAYLDDDAVAPKDWLNRILDCFEQCGDTVGCVGGPVEPLWEATRPEWLPDSLLPFLTVMNLGEKACDLDGETFLFGTNFATSRRLLEETGGYREDLGPIGRWHRSGEDTYVQRRIRRAGYRVRYEPAIRVHHRVHRERVQKRWVLRRMYWEGLARARQNLDQDLIDPAQHRALARKALRRFLHSPRRLVLCIAPTGRSASLFERKAASRRRLGAVAGYLGFGGRKR